MVGAEGILAVRAQGLDPQSPRANAAVLVNTHNPSSGEAQAGLLAASDLVREPVSKIMCNFSCRRKESKLSLPLKHPSNWLAVLVPEDVLQAPG